MVDNELDLFERRLRAELTFQLSVHIHMTAWEQLDRLEHDTWENINATIRDVFAPRVRQYGYTPVAEMFQVCRNVLIHVVWSAMNVPFPRNPFSHIDSVIENALDVFRMMSRPAIRVEMLIANHYAQLIQRNWRRVITDPSYAVCRTRLLAEFHELVS